MAAPGLGNRRRVVMAIEDDDEVYSRIRSALTDLGSGLEVQRVKGREDALRFLRKASPYEQAQTPRLVIIDISSSTEDAQSFVTEMREQVYLPSLPVVVVGPQPALQSPLDAQFYIHRSVDCDAFSQQLKEACLVALWFFAP